jgi:hypothetical protein
MTCLREVTDAVQALLKGEKVTYAGEHVHLDAVSLTHPPNPAPPLRLGVRGPKGIASHARHRHAAARRGIPQINPLGVLRERGRHPNSRHQQAISDQIRFPWGPSSTPQRLDRAATSMTPRPPVGAASGAQRIGGCGFKSSTAILTPVSVAVIDTRNGELACTMAFVASSDTTSDASPIAAGLPQAVSASFTKHLTARRADGTGMYSSTASPSNSEPLPLAVAGR